MTAVGDVAKGEIFASYFVTALVLVSIYVSSDENLVSPLQS